MQRYLYKLNSFFSQSYPVGKLMPVFMTEVVPGETHTFKINLRIISNPTKNLVLNRCYYDIFTFYVPWRTVWPDWTLWISQREGGQDPSLQIPTSPHRS